MDPNVQPQVNTPNPAPAQQSDTAVLAQPVVQAMGDITDVQQPVGSARAKESGPISAEVSPFVEVVGGDTIEKEPLPPEVASWMEKVSRDTSGEKPPEIVIADVANPPTTLPRSSSQVFVLPLGEDALQKGSHQGVSNSVRWLAEWCKRLVKKLGEQAAYR